MINWWSLVAAFALGSAILLSGIHRVSKLSMVNTCAQKQVVQWSWLTRAWRGLPDAPSIAFRIVCGVAGAAVILLVFGDSIVGKIGAVSVGCLVFVLVGRKQTRAAKQKQRELVEQADAALDLIAAALGSGAPLRVAVRSVAESSPEPTASFLRAIDNRTLMGGSDEEAWSSVNEDSPWLPVARDIVRSVDTGAGLAELLKLHAEDLRRDYGAARERRARTVGVRAVFPLMGCFLPAFILVGVVPIIAGSFGLFLFA